MFFFAKVAVARSSSLNPLVPKGAEIKIRQFNFESTVEFVKDKNGLSQCAHL